MADALVHVEATDHFLARLDTIGDLFEEADASAAFVRLLDDLQSIVIPNLARFPEMGRRFVDLEPRATEALTALRALPMADLGCLREYLHGDYLILYAQADKTLYLMTIRHHRELAHDFLRIWPHR